MNPSGVSGNIFQTQADQAANGFANQQNMAYMYPGWGMNPNFRTPAHDAPYRPGWSGVNPYSAYNRPSFLGSINQVVSPFNKDPYWGNPVDNNMSAYVSFATKPFDAAAVIGQRFIAPTVLFGAATATMSGVGQRFGAGLATGMFGSMAAPGVTNSIGGMFGSVAVPLAVGYAATRAVDSAVFQPYIRSRQMMETTMDSFSGITFGNGFGNPISGRGLSGYQSARIGSQIDRMGIGDMTFNAAQFGGIGAMAMRSGLLDNTQAEDITKKIGSIASQIKMIVSISKDPNIQSAIAELANLQRGGASTMGGYGSTAASAYSSLGMTASAAGTSIQRLMGTVGAQGQYMFQMNGLTPFLGQLAAGNAFAGFSSAQRIGLFGSAQLARLGGVDGATQSAVAAQLSGMNTPFNMMRVTNRFLGNGETSGVVDTVSQFGAAASRDPFRMRGAMSLYGAAMLSGQAKDEGVKVTENNAVALLKALGRRPGKDGYDPSDVASILESQGMPPEQIQAYMSLRSAQTNPTAVANQIAGFNAQMQEQARQVVSQHALHNGGLMGMVGTGKRFAYGVGQNLADTFAYPVTRATGSTMDFAMKTLDSIMMGNTIRTDDSISVDAMQINVKEAQTRVGGKNVSYSVIKKLNDAARGSGPSSGVAKQLLRMGFDSPKSKELFAKFLAMQDDPELRREYEKLDKSDSLFRKVKDGTSGLISEVPAAERNADIMKVLGTNDAGLADKVAAEAQTLYMMDGPIGLNLNDRLGSGRFNNLSAALAGLGSTEAKAEKLNAIALATLRRAGINIRGDATVEEIRASLRAPISRDENTARVLSESTSEVNYKTLSDNFQKFENGTKVFLDGVTMLVKHLEGKGLTTMEKMFPGYSAGKKAITGG